MRPDSPPNDSDTIDLTEPRTSTKGRSAAAALTRGKDMNDYTSVRRTFEERESSAEDHCYECSASIGLAG